MAHIYAALPPHRLHSSKPVSPNDALSLLSSYIAAAETDAALQPNAILTEAGPTSSAQGSGAGLTIHNLKRVEAGLKGEQLGADLTFSKHGGEGMPGLLMDDGSKEMKLEKKRKRTEAKEVEMGAEGWEDKDEFERKRGNEVNMDDVDIGERVQGNVDLTQRADATVDENGVVSKSEKEARKQAKKQRAKAEKKDREKKRQAEKND